MTHIQIVQLIILSGTHTVFSVKSPEPQQNQGGNRTRRSHSVSFNTNGGGCEIQRRQSQRSSSNRNPPPTSLWVQCRQHNSTDDFTSAARAIHSETVQGGIPLHQVHLPSYSSVQNSTVIDSKRLTPPPPYSEEVPSAHQVLARGTTVNNSLECSLSSNTSLNVHTRSSATSLPGCAVSGISLTYESETSDYRNRHLTEGMSSTGQLPSTEHVTSTPQTAFITETPGKGSFSGHKSTENVLLPGQTPRWGHLSSSGCVSATRCAQSTENHSSICEGQVTGQAQRNGQMSVSGGLKRYELSSQQSNETGDHKSSRQKPNNRHNPVSGCVQEPEHEDIPMTVIDIDENYEDCESHLLVSSSENCTQTIPITNYCEEEISSEIHSPETSCLHLSPCCTSLDKMETPQDLQRVNIISHKEEKSEYSKDNRSEQFVNCGRTVQNRSENRNLPGDILETNIDMDQRDHENYQEIHSIPTDSEVMDSTNKKSLLLDNAISNSPKISQNVKLSHTKLKPPQHSDSIPNQITIFDKKRLNQVKVRECFNEPFLRSECDKYGRMFCYELTFDDVEVMMLNDEKDDTAPVYFDVGLKDSEPDLLHALNNVLEERGKVSCSSYDSDNGEYEWEV